MEFFISHREPQRQCRTSERGCGKLSLYDIHSNQGGEASAFEGDLADGKGLGATCTGIFYHDR